MLLEELQESAMLADLLATDGRCCPIALEPT
jgi:hypothetical protein